MSRSDSVISEADSCSICDENAADDGIIDMSGSLLGKRLKSMQAMKNQSKSYHNINIPSHGINLSSLSHSVQVSGRKRKVRDYYEEFKNILGEDEAISFLNKFREYDSSNKEHDLLMADGMIQSLIVTHGMTNHMLMKVLRIGNTRYYRIKRNEGKKLRGGTNVNKVTEEMLNSLHRFVMGLVVDEGRPCVHGRVKKYIIDDGLFTWMQVHSKYLEVVPDDERKMPYKTFHKYIRSLFPGNER